MLRWIVLLLTSSLAAQVAPLPKYRVVKGGRIDAVNALADQGYRLIVPGELIIMRLESTPPDTYRYVAMNPDVGRDQFLTTLNGQGAHGYRWVPGGGVGEKEPHPKNFEYSFIAPPGWNGKTKPETIASLTDKDYRLVDSVFFAATIGPGAAEVLFQREVEATPKSVPTTKAPEIEIIRASRADSVLGQLNERAKKGYRYLWPYDSGPAGGWGDWIQKCEPECEQGFEYRYFSIHSMDQMDKDLNAEGKNGFRVVPARLRSTTHLLERAGGENETYAYHVIRVKDPEPLEQALNAPDQEGYVPIGYVWRVGWTGDEFLLLEKRSTASRTQ